MSAFKKKLMILIFAAVLAGLSRFPAEASFTVEDEKKLGREFYDKLDKSNAILHDEKISAYVNAVGNRVLSASDRRLFDFRFSVIRSDAVNAFATPGGYVYVNRGLINLCEKESELAGVLAHEIAHVNARHIAQTIERSQKLNMAALAGMLAGAFLGGGGDLSAAMMGFSYATAASLYLRYSREQEEEADRLGMMYLAGAGYDPPSMLDFLKSMRKYEFYSNTVPSYFLTHPGTDERVRYLDGLIQTAYSSRGKESILGNFKRIQTRLLITSGDLEANRRRFQNGLNKNPLDVDDLYGLAVTEEKAGNLDLAIATFRRALSLAPQDADILRDLGRTYLKGGHTDEALLCLNESLRQEPGDPEALLLLGQAYEAKGDFDKAVSVLDLLKGKRIDDDDYFYTLAKIHGRAGHKFESHYNFGIYFKRKKRTESALFHFKAALQSLPPGDGRAEEVKGEIAALSGRGDMGQRGREPSGPR